MIDTLYLSGAALLGGAWPVVWTLIKIIAVVAPLMVC
ncbi:NADH-quinone oxidoreductase subunit H, partial [Roseateles sp. GG27B]